MTDYGNQSSKSTGTNNSNQAGKTKRKARLFGVTEIIMMIFVVAIILFLAVGAKYFDSILSKMRLGDVGTTVYPTLYSEYVKKASADYGVEEERIYAVIKVESDFKPTSHSAADARGLMQMLPSTYEDVCKRRGLPYRPEELFDPKTNIDACTYYLSWLYERLGNWDNVHIAYNAGIGNVNKWLEDPRYCKDGIIVTTPKKQANAYIEKINYYYNEYKNCR